MTAQRTPVHSGGCQCGAVRYELYAEPANASICHCRMCQKAFGAFYAPLAGVSMDDFSVTRGTLSIFKSSDAVERGFCNACGTPLTFRYVVQGAEPASEGVANEMNVSIGSLDQPARVKPTIQYGTESKLPWVDTLAHLPGKETSASANHDILSMIQSTNHQHPDCD